MKNKGCLDTGIITQFYSENPPKKIINLMKDVRNKKMEVFIIYPILVEAYFHICKLLGKIAAETRIASFINSFPIKLVNLNSSLIFKAGELKCKYSNILSYNDCLLIAYALNRKIYLHTTEKNLQKVLPTLKVEEYEF
ncbi:MAG: hypothetical protein BAJALOKI1v1_1790004 [Promethearchaeota archaeon]|nr:MAG: hypothetical protein BAJALOKI1v1_1790004 [Candidatus Lokiarchaeota archaeon]